MSNSLRNLDISYSELNAMVSTMIMETVLDQTLNFIVLHIEFARSKLGPPKQALIIFWLPNALECRQGSNESAMHNLASDGRCL